MNSSPRFVLGLAWFSLGYSLFYYAVNILVDAYAPSTNAPMNPAPLAVCLGLSSPVGPALTHPSDFRRRSAGPRRHPHNTGGFQ